MSQDKNKQNHIDPEIAIENALGRTELFFEKNGKKLLTVLIVLVLGITAFFGYQQFIRKPHLEKASYEMVYAQNQFAQDSLTQALKGNGTNLGFEQIVTEYAGTPQANLAKQYIGLSYLQLGEFQKAIDAFESFEAVSGPTGTLLTAQNLGLTGDAYSELGNTDKALEFYNKASQYHSNIDTTPKYTFRAAMILMDKGDNAKANEMCNSIKSNYPNTPYSRDIEKYIGLTAQKMAQ